LDLGECVTSRKRKIIFAVRQKDSYKQKGSLLEEKKKLAKKKTFSLWNLEICLLCD